MKPEHPTVVLGAGGHARVLLDALQLLGAEVLGIVDASRDRKGELVLGVPILGSDEDLGCYAPDKVLLVNGLGSTSNTRPREVLFTKFRDRGYRFATIIHPRSVLSPHVVLGEGAQIFGGVVLNAGTKIGENTIVNTSASVDHDCLVGAHVHIAPGVTLSGGVMIGDGVHLGTGANVVQGVKIGERALVGAGSLVLRDIPSGARAWGVPAKVVDR